MFVATKELMASIATFLVFQSWCPVISISTGINLPVKYSNSYSKWNMMHVRHSSKEACALNWLLLRHFMISSNVWLFVSLSSSLSAYTLSITFDRHTEPAC